MCRPNEILPGTLECHTILQLDDIIGAIEHSFSDIYALKAGRDATEETRTAKRPRRQSLRGSGKRMKFIETSSDEEYVPGSSRKGKKSGIVDHNYHDYAFSPVKMELEEPKAKNSTASCVPFPLKLHRLLEAATKEGFDDVVSWQPHGRAFHVHNHQRFVDEIMPRYFRQTRFPSFQRQLSLYGFLRLYQKTKDNDAYYHEMFLRGRADLCAKIQRQRVKGYGVRQSACPDKEPDFYHMPYVGPYGSVVSEDGEEIQHPIVTPVTPEKPISEDPNDKYSFPATIFSDDELVYESQRFPVPEIPPMPSLSKAAFVDPCKPLTLDEAVLVSNEELADFLRGVSFEEKDETQRFFQSEDYLAHITSYS